jgi:hypothetical protein
LKQSTCRTGLTVPQKDNDNFKVTLPPNDPWHGEMTLPKTKPDDELDKTDQTCPGYKNVNTAWWDASQIYGSNEEKTQELRNKLPDGKLELTERGTVAFLPRDKDGNVQTGFNNNWWIGMELLHTLFAKEHNAICDALKKDYPNMNGDEIFDKARLINSALMAKVSNCRRGLSNIVLTSIRFTPLNGPRPFSPTRHYRLAWPLTGGELLARS